MAKKSASKSKTVTAAKRGEAAKAASAPSSPAEGTQAAAQPAGGSQPLAMLPPVAPPAVLDTVYISFSAEIVPKTCEALLAVLADQVNRQVRHVYLMLSTPGGNVMNGLNLYNVLRALPVRLTTHNVGNVDSIGNAIFLAGEERFACPHSTFMFHGVGFDGVAGVRLEEKLLRERLNSILADQRRIGSIVGERTQLKPRQIVGLFRQAQTKDAAYARANGIVHDIRDVQIPKGATVLQLVFQR
jgi:ATP-dependent protease ClpP protease subunit